MGVDAVIYATGNATVAEHWFDLAWEQQADRAVLVRADDFRIDRYYGPGYERGDWPNLYAAIRKLQTAFPLAKVYYTDDHAESAGDPANECTPEFLESIWTHYLGLHGNDYRRS